MARSKYIYVVTSPGRRIVAAFTVKHELVTWLKRESTVDQLAVWRHVDGPVKFDPVFVARAVDML